MTQLGNQYKSMTTDLNNQCNGLYQFIHDSKYKPGSKLQSIESTFRQLESHKLEVEGLRDSFIAKKHQQQHSTRNSVTSNRNSTTSKDSPVNQPRSSTDTLPPMDIMQKFGTTDMTVNQFNNLVLKLQHEVNSVDHRTIIGTYKDCYLGEELVSYLKTKHGFREPDVCFFY